MQRKGFHTHILLLLNIARVQGSTNGTNGIQISFNANMVPLALTMVPLVKLPMVPLGEPRTEPLIVNRRTVRSVRRKTGTLQTPDHRTDRKLNRLEADTTRKNNKELEICVYETLCPQCNNLNINKYFLTFTR